MTNNLTVACIQNCATPHIEENLAECEKLSRAASADGAELICLPEYFSSLDIRDNLLLGNPYKEEKHPALPLFKSLAQELNAMILLGSLAIDMGQDKFSNRSFLINQDGNIVTCYDKIHLFDVNLPGGETYLESGTVCPGERAVLANTPWGSLGLSICYDLRFAQLYRSLAQAGATMLAVPAAFTKTTGEAHWHVLLRARAIETGAFVFAPSQYGEHAGGRACYGHSLIVDPWGRILADAGEDAGYAIATIDLDEVSKARSMIAALKHDRDFAPPAQKIPADLAGAAE
ncbi:MAG: carbon-nitrogen hydrolase family protein [Pseudomonadota bacterium]